MAQERINTTTEIRGENTTANIISQNTDNVDLFSDFAKTYFDNSIPILNGDKLTNGHAIVRLKDEDRLSFLIDINGRLYSRKNEKITDENYLLNADGHLIAQKL